MNFKRYAIYYLPEPGPLAAFGAAWLGWDAASGQDMAHPRIDGLPLPVEHITDTPRKYGLHATIKPPFRLAPGTTENALNDALAAFCADQPPVTLDGLDLAQAWPLSGLAPGRGRNRAQRPGHKRGAHPRCLSRAPERDRTDPPPRRDPQPRNRTHCCCNGDTPM